MGTRTYIGEYNKELQERLFKLGFTWQTGALQVVTRSMTFLFVDYDKRKISYIADMTFFHSCVNYTEVPIGELFSKIEKLEIEQGT